MRDISLHILDLIENSLRAGATIVSVNIARDSQKGTLNVSVEDNGSGFSVSPDEAVDPFYTTKSGKRTGLGLSLFAAAAERAAGKLEITRSRLGGACVAATMALSHVDRSPMGDLASTLSSVVCTNPQLDLRFKFSAGDREFALRVVEVVKEVPESENCGLTAARKVLDRIRSGLAQFESRGITLESI
jgi:anti-sigma regulatory factor (Ser/Thr protein kinase)